MPDRFATPIDSWIPLFWMNRTFMCLLDAANTEHTVPIPNGRRWFANDGLLRVGYDVKVCGGARGEWSAKPRSPGARSESSPISIAGPRRVREATGSASHASDEDRPERIEGTTGAVKDQAAVPAHVGHGSLEGGPIVHCANEPEP